MIDSMTSLSLKPITVYTGGKGKKTTITSFEDILKKEKLTKEEQTALSQINLERNLAGRTGGASSDADATEGTASKNTAGDAFASTEKTEEVTYRDPATGVAVRYVDVADSGKNSSTSAVSGADSVNATSASSMKKTKYDEYFKKAALKYDVSESLLKAIAKAESNFNANAVSSAGAIGVMQLMPATAQGLGVKNAYDPEQNIMGGAKCISQKLKEFHGDVRLALAAYNAGSGAVKRYGGVPSYCKTYVNRVLSYKEAFETASAVG